MQRIALFPGSFDPFTRGHADIVARALPLFDRLVIAVGVNEAKTSEATATARVQQIADLYRDEPRVQVTSYTSLTTQLAQAVGARFIVRGLRGVRDMEYERDMAELNRRLTGIETLFLLSSPELGCISSSAVRELEAFGEDVTPFLPPKP